MTEILIENSQDKIEIPDEIYNVIQTVIQETLIQENWDAPAEVSVTIVDNEEIRALNRAHRDQDTPTDVLSFPMLAFGTDGEILDGEYDYDGENIMLGDIVLSAERAMRQAAEYGHSFVREIAFLTAHSMLHLLGYDHVDDPQGEAAMCRKQEAVLTRLGITRE